MMRKKTLVVCAVLFSLCGVWVFHSRNLILTHAPGLDSSNTDHGSSGKRADSDSQVERVKSRVKSLSEDIDISAIANTDAYLSRAALLGKALNRKIDFYGRILDQNDAPVEGVRIDTEISYFGELANPGLVPNQRLGWITSDADGRFSVEGEHGLALTLRLEASNVFDFEPDYFGYSFQEVGTQPGSSVSTLAKPFVFHAFKRGPSAVLVTGSLFSLCEQDGRFYSVFLRERKISTERNNGDFRVSLIRPPGWSDKLDFDWHVKMEAINIHFQESNDVFMNYAPDSGYLQSWQISQQAGAGAYVREKTARFYLKSNDGQTYGKMEATFKPDYRDKFGVRFTYWINESGSRNLQLEHKLTNQGQ